LASLERDRVPSPRPIASKEVPLVDRAEEMDVLNLRERNREGPWKILEDPEDEQAEIPGRGAASEERTALAKRSRTLPRIYKNNRHYAFNKFDQYEYLD